MLSSKSCGTGTHSISSHDPSRRAIKTVAPGTAIKAQIPNCSLEDIHENPKGPNINPGAEQNQNLEIVKPFTYTLWNTMSKLSIINDLKTQCDYNS